VDGIVGMEGDGPLMGTPKHLGCILIGRNLPAVDATCTRLIGLNPHGVPYIEATSGRLGPIKQRHITQRGERPESFQSTFRLLDLPHLSGIAMG